MRNLDSSEAENKRGGAETNRHVKAEMEHFRGGGGEAIGGRTGGPAYTETDPAPLGFVGSSGACGDRSSLYCLFIQIFKFLLVATLLTILGVFAFGLLRGLSVSAALNGVRNTFCK